MPNNIPNPIKIEKDFILGTDLYAPVDMPQTLLLHNQKVRGCKLSCMCEGCKADKENVSDWFNEDGTEKRMDIDWTWLFGRKLPIPHGHLSIYNA